MERDSRMMVRADAKATGMVTAQTTRHTAPWATLRTRCVGTDVKVTYADGSTETRPVSSFRKSRKSKSNQPRQARSSHASNYAARLARFGSTEQYD